MVLFIFPNITTFDLLHPGWEGTHFLIFWVCFICKFLLDGILWTLDCSTLLNTAILNFFLPLGFPKYVVKRGSWQTTEVFTDSPTLQLVSKTVGTTRSPLLTLGSVRCLIFGLMSTRFNPVIFWFGSLLHMWSLSYLQRLWLLIEVY